MSRASSSPETPSPAPGEPPRPPGNWRTTTLVVAVAIALVAIPLLTVGLPVEIAYWHLANANVQQREGDIEAALLSLKRAAEYAPDDVSVHRLRCEIFRECGELEASLAAADRALELAPGDPESQLARGETLLKMERFAEAVDAIESATGSEDGVVTAAHGQVLNLLAYARSLAGENLDQALIEVNQALDLHEDAPDMSRAAMLDTRGFILLQLGQHEEALADLEKAVADSDPRRFEHLADQGSQILSPEEIEESRARVQQGFAVMLYHRGLVHRAMGHDEQAKADFAEVRKLGFEPDEGLF